MESKKQSAKPRAPVLARSAHFYTHWLAARRGLHQSDRFVLLAVTSTFLLAHSRTSDRITADQVAQLTGLSPRTVRDILARLVAEGLLIRGGTRKDPIIGYVAVPDSWEVGNATDLCSEIADPLTAWPGNADRGQVLTASLTASLTAFPGNADIQGFQGYQNKSAAAAGGMDIESKKKEPSTELDECALLRHPSTLTQDQTSAPTPPSSMNVVGRSITPHLSKASLPPDEDPVFLRLLSDLSPDFVVGGKTRERFRDAYVAHPAGFFDCLTDARLRHTGRPVGFLDRKIRDGDHLNPIPPRPTDDGYAFICRDCSGTGYELSDGRAVRCGQCRGSVWMSWGVEDPDPDFEEIALELERDGYRVFGVARPAGQTPSEGNVASSDHAK